VVSPNVTTTYRLSAVSGNGSCDVDQFITVNVAACPTPQIMSFTATPNAVLIGGNSMVRLAWSINDTSGTGVTITIPGAGTFTNPNSFVDITQPQSTTIYTLSVTSGCGSSSSAQTQVTASACPAPGITSFTATPSTVTIGGSQTVRLAWSVTDASGTGVSVTIAGIGTWPTTQANDIVSHRKRRHTHSPLTTVAEPPQPPLRYK
jgi:acyl-[acyl carrier protein]--UDP-N-acetylglucosamine O-acyltransferase